MATQLQNDMDNAEGGLTPLGLAQNRAFPSTSTLSKSRARTQPLISSRFNQRAAGASVTLSWLSMMPRVFPPRCGRSKTR